MDELERRYRTEELCFEKFMSKKKFFRENMAPNVFHDVLRHLSIKMIDYDPNFVAPANDMVNNPVIRNLSLNSSSC